MKPTTIVISLVLGLLTLSLLGGFGSSAASGGRGLPAAASDESTLEQARPTGQSQSDDVAGVDADLGKIGRNIDRETYLRLRDEWLAEQLNQAVQDDRLGVPPASQPRTMVGPTLVGKTQNGAFTGGPWSCRATAW